MAIVTVVVLMLVIAGFFVWRLSKSEPAAATPAAPGDPDASPPFAPWPVPAPRAPDLASEPSGWTPPAELASLRAFERVRGAVAVADISPDGREAMLSHSDASFTIFDVASGKAIETWQDVCSEEWVDYVGEANGVNCAKRRLFLSRELLGRADHVEENVLIDLEKRQVKLLYACRDDQDSIGVASISADGNYAASVLAYGKSHPTFDLEHGKTGEYGDLVLAAGTVWPETAMSRDGDWFALDLGDGDVLTLKRDADYDGAVGDDRDGQDADSDIADNWGMAGPGYSEWMSCGGDEPPACLDFDSAGDRLLVVDENAGLVVADLATKDFKLVKALPEPDATDPDADGYGVDGATWVNDSDYVILTLLKPEPKFVLVDVVAESVVREMPVAEATARHATVARTGGFALIDCADGAPRALPLLDAAA